MTVYFSQLELSHNRSYNVAHREFNWKPCSDRIFNIWFVVLLVLMIQNCRLRFSGNYEVLLLVADTEVRVPASQQCLRNLSCYWYLMVCLKVSNFDLSKHIFLVPHKLAFIHCSLFFVVLAILLFALNFIRLKTIQCLACAKERVVIMQGKRNRAATMYIGLSSSVIKLCDCIFVAT